MAVRRRATRVVLRGVALALTLSMMMPLPSALADCQPDSVVDGAEVVCAGTDTDGLNAGQGTRGVTITIEDAATVEAPDTTILFGSETTVVNNGLVRSGNDYALYGYADGRVVNNGSLVLESTYSSEFTGDAVVRFLGSEGVVENYGLISASGTGIRTTLAGVALTSNSQFLNSGDVIVDVTEGEDGSSGYGAYISIGSYIRNMGLIRVSATDVPASLTGLYSGGYSVFALVNDGDIEVVLGGTQTFFGPLRVKGIDMGPQQSVFNNGSIAASTNAPGGRAYGIFGSPDIFRNTGSVVVEASDEAGLSYGIFYVLPPFYFQDSPGEIVNSGTIDADIAIYANGYQQYLNNTGTIRGDIVLLGGDDLVDLGDGSTIEGDIDAGDGMDSFTSQGHGSISGRIAGLENFTVTGGELALALEDGSDFGTMSIDAGIVHLSGAVTGDIAIASGASLDGTASITGDIQNAGILAPGNSVGTMTVNGDYTQAAVGELFVELGTVSGDRLDVAGAAALDGVLATALQGNDPEALEGRSYTVVSAGGISGEFDNTGTVEQGFWTLAIARAGNAVTVTIVDVDTPLGASEPVTAALASALNQTSPAIQSQLSDGQQTSLDYDSMGDWESTAASFNGNWNALGDRTPAVSLPKTGSAEFEGTTKGELTETGSPEAFVVEGNVMLTADFARGLVNADFTGMEKIDRDGVASAWVDFRARMSIADGTSEFAGTAGSDDGVWNGEARGGFFGDDDGMPGHAAGLWSISSPLGRALGGFTARRQ